MATTELSPAEERLQACVDEYGLLGVVKVLLRLYGSARISDVLLVAERPSADEGGRLKMDVAPHPFERLGWRWWLCRHCYAPKSLHPRRGWKRARPLGDHQYISAGAPHFKEGW